MDNKLSQLSNVEIELKKAFQSDKSTKEKKIIFQEKRILEKYIDTI
jgi:hypothetical protein